jgi:hypothetical protein
VNTTATPRPPVADLDMAAIGRCLVRMVAVANVLGHKRLTGTLRDYVDDSDEAPPEARFLRDALVRPIPEVIEEWFGDRRIADAIVQAAAFGERAQPETCGLAVSGPWSGSGQCGGT